MHIAGIYSFNAGQKVIEKRYPHLLKEIESVIAGVDASKCRTKKSKEITMRGQMLYSPPMLNKAFVAQFENKGDWEKHKVSCEYPETFYTKQHVPDQAASKRSQRPYREMDFVKEKLGVEVQFGKYSFMVYNVCAKMTIFSKLDVIDAGVEIVPVKAFTKRDGKRTMSTGVSYFEQFVWDLEHRGVSDIDIPVLIIGIQ